MQSRNWIPALSLAVLFALQATAPNAQEAVGKATSVRPQAEGSHAGTLSGGSNVYSKETVRTGDAGSGGLAISRQEQSQCRTKIERPAR